ncbi:protein SET DOMAIN GROUP 40-like [Silene latifolia]|uniref:protein SET DOMAIN GROUP 40-like n=1 Tax=Silene latifolia TaxID=37657 RepID=UPI003D789B58
MEDVAANLDNFLKWATSLGVSDTPPSSSASSNSCLGYSLSVSYFPDNGGRGMAAVRELKKGELILRVPKSALLTTDSVVQKDHNSALALSTHPCLSSTQVLSVCLLAEMNKGRKSAWYPYLMQLPRSYDTLASFAPFEAKALQVDDAIWLAEKVISKAELEWKEAIGLLDQLNLKPRFLTFKAWLWSSATISSRTLHVPWDAAGCLCPVGDFFNYACPGEELAAIGVSKSYVDDTKDHGLDGEHFSERLTDGGYEEEFAAYCFYAKKNYQKNEQVLLSYGTYTNLELLEHYGFLLNENPNDKVFLPLGHDIHTCHSWPSDSLYIQHDGTPSFALLAALRLWATPPNQRKTVSYLASSGSLLSSENEKKVMTWIISNCRAILRSLPSNIEDDKLIFRAINKAQEAQSIEIPNNVSSVTCMEFRKFTESMAFGNGENEVVPRPWMKMKRYMERWKLAIQWRLRYKQSIRDCISFCSHIIEVNSSKNDAIM